MGPAACHRSRPIPPAPRPVLGSVEVFDDSLHPREEEKIDVVAIGTRLQRALEASGLVQSGAPGGSAAAVLPDGPVLRLVARVGVELVEVETKGIVRAAVTLRLSTRPSDAPGAINDELSAGGEQVYQPGASLDRRRLEQVLVERTATDLLAGFISRARLATATPAEVHVAIVGDAGALREEAIRVAGARGLREEVPTLLPLLQADEESVRDAALGALIALRERRAVTALTKTRSLRDRHEMRKILEAISILGGEEAREYLGFVAESHDDEEIRKLASDAKQRMLRREEAGVR